jgi:SBF-like CPA transporter family (DUF4137)
VESRRGEAAKALLSWPAALWVAAFSLLLSPLAALSVRAMPLAGAAPGLALGLAAWYCVPTTLSRSIALTEVLCRISGSMMWLARTRCRRRAPQACTRLCCAGLHAGRQPCALAAALRLCLCRSESHTLTSVLFPALQRAGGNTAFALLTAVGANIAALATVPLLAGPLLQGLLPRGCAMPPPGIVLAALLRLCVLPLGAGVAARRCLPGVEQQDSHRLSLRAPPVTAHGAPAEVWCSPLAWRLRWPGVSCRPAWLWLLGCVSNARITAAPSQPTGILGLHQQT